VTARDMLVTGSSINKTINIDLYTETFIEFIASTAEREGKVLSAFIIKSEKLYRIPVTKIITMACISKSTSSIILTPISFEINELMY
jgi:hypothetical protein